MDEKGQGGRFYKYKVHSPLGLIGSPWLFLASPKFVYFWSGLQIDRT